MYHTSHNIQHASHNIFHILSSEFINNININIKSCDLTTGHHWSCFFGLPWSSHVVRPKSQALWLQSLRLDLLGGAERPAAAGGCAASEGRGKVVSLAWFKGKSGGSHGFNMRKPLFSPFFHGFSNEKHEETMVFPMKLSGVCGKFVLNPMNMCQR